MIRRAAGLRNLALAALAGLTAFSASDSASADGRVPVAEILQALLDWDEFQPHLGPPEEGFSALRVICLAEGCEFARLHHGEAEVRVFPGVPASLSLRQLVIETMEPMAGAEAGGYTLGFRYAFEGLHGSAAVEKVAGEWVVTAGELVEE